LVDRTQLQVDAKKSSVEFYQNKVSTAGSQMQALIKSKGLKIEQLKNKLEQSKNKLIGEKAELAAAINDYNLTKDQYERQEKMYQEGLVSQTQLQQRNTATQNAFAKKIMIENKIAQTQQELTNIQIEQNSIEQEYIEKISKTEGDKYQSLSQIATGSGEIAKLQNQVSNYVIRNGMYIILAPQDGQIIQANKAGIGEILKEGEQITVIVPNDVNHAVEMFIGPIDLPLINRGTKVRFTFDGYPAIVFSGWPESSYGTFGGKVIAIENAIGDNGLFRILVASDSSDRKWPTQLKIGNGAQGISLLKDVPIWYELWRNINGFPPDYYQGIRGEKNVAKKSNTK
jgi:multidrug resistance efflux pump